MPRSYGSRISRDDMSQDSNEAPRIECTWGKRKTPDNMEQGDVNAGRAIDRMVGSECAQSIGLVHDVIVGYR